MLIYYLEDLEITEHTWGHTARSQVEGRSPGVLLLLRVGA